MFSTPTSLDDGRGRQENMRAVWESAARAALVGVEGDVDGGVAGGVVGGIVSAVPPLRRYRLDRPRRNPFASAGRSRRRTSCVASNRSTHRSQRTLRSAASSSSKPSSILKVLSSL